MADLNDALRTSIAADAVASLDRLEILDGSLNTLVTFTITWGAGSAGVQEVQSTPVEGTAGAAGTAASARLYNNAGSPDEQITGLTVGTSGTDVTIDNTSISNGQTVNLTSLSITMPAALS
jgi:hypothetical protein